MIVIDGHLWSLMITDGHRWSLKVNHVYPVSIIINDGNDGRPCVSERDATGGSQK